ncbi:hypothetical protein OUZ56_016734 [Daphnia magna]|uniref:Uncharacterized protein n=1 Tax=Daphnia magna TaxID=35525 RepID=A0ABR0ARE9_9CRUS|nr:hypothetical protein OUZ56_016734 [Daphnia magna]
MSCRHVLPDSVRPLNEMELERRAKLGEAGATPTCGIDEQDFLASSQQKLSHANSAYLSHNARSIQAIPQTAAMAARWLYLSIL